jgi:hypothetical protein
VNGLRLIGFVSLFQTLSLLSPAWSQENIGKIAGTVTIENNEPALGANVLLVGTKLGCQVGQDGSFLVEAIPAGVYVVEVRLVGYQPATLSDVTVRSGRTVHVELQLRQQSIEMNQVVVTGSRRQDASDVRSSVTTMTPHESKILPGAGEDVLRSLQSLPGVTSISDFSSQLVIRGSGPDQNLILLDGFEALNPYRLYGFISMFNPETVGDISLQTGGFAAEYGDRLSAVLDVKNRKGRTDTPFGAKINTSLTNLNIVAEGALPLEGSSYLVSVRRTYYDLILGPVLKSTGMLKGDVALPNFRDLQTRVVVPVGTEHELSVDVLTSRDGVSLISGNDRSMPDSVNMFDLTYNSLVGMAWRWTPSAALAMETRLSWYRNEGSGSFDGSFVDPSQNTGLLSKADAVGLRFETFSVDYDFIYGKTSLAQRWLYASGSHSIEAGIGVDHLSTDFVRSFSIDDALKAFLEQRGQVVPTDVTLSNGYNRSDMYLQDRIAIGSSMFVQPGIRVDYYPFLKQRWYISPRANVSFKLDDLSTLRAALGIYYQSPGMEKQDMRAPLAFTGSSFATLSAERATHYIVGFDHMLNPEWQLKVDTYFKHFSNTVVPQKLQGGVWKTTRVGSDLRDPSSYSVPFLVPSDSLTDVPVNDATGRSYGFEFMLQKIRTMPEERFTGWVSYALSYATILRDGIESPFNFDQRHAVNIVGNYRFAERWDVGARFTLRSGRPQRAALGVNPRVVLRNVGGQVQPVVQTDSNGNTILDVVYERDTYTARLAMYQSLDLRVTTYPEWWGLDWSIYLDVQNLYNRNNEQEVSYFVTPDGMLGRRAIYGIPIFPSIGLTLIF